MIHQEQFSLIGAAEKIIYGDFTYDNKNTNTPVVIFIHGFKGFKDWGAHDLMARYFVKNGYRFLKFNLSHNGVTANNFHDISDVNSFADNTFSKEMIDIEIIIAHAVKYLGVDSVYLVGHSRGGGLAILTAAISPYVKGLATWSAISDFSNLWKKDDEKDWRKNGKIEIINARTKKKMHLNLALLEDFENNKDELDIVAAAKKINVPWLILHGEDDVSVPIDAALVLAGANVNSRLIKIANADHVYGAMHPFVGETLTPQLIEVGEKTLKFFKSIEFG